MGEGDRPAAQNHAAGPQAEGDHGRTSVWSAVRNRVARGVTDSPDNLTTDPPRPPGTRDVDDLVGYPVPTGEQRTEPDNEDVSDDTASVEPPD